jgi:ubiquinone/menaquinone biosynthesis C-methylase UbiE
MPASRKFWDKRAGRYDAKLSKGPNYAARLERAAAVIKDTDDVLDLGCASGEITLDLAPLAGQIRGIDHSANMVEVAGAKARERGIANARFEQMEPADPRLAEGAFNVVTAYSVIHLLGRCPRDACSLARPARPRRAPDHRDSLPRRVVHRLAGPDQAGRARRDGATDPEPEGRRV